MTLVPLDVERHGDEPSWVVQAADGRSFAVFRVAGGFRVTDAVCPHNKGPLDQGWVREGTLLVCPWHWYRFDVETGTCVTTPEYTLGVHPAVERDGQWFAEIGEPARELSWAERLRAHARGE